MLGGSVINMSASPEAKLAREAEMAYQMICMSTDYDCWHDSGDVSVELVMGHMKANAGNAQSLVATVLDELSKKEHAELIQGTKWKGHSKSGCSTHKDGLNAETAKKIQWLFPDFFD
jgi:5'-methylthioadenosine phosphorylase